MKTHHLTFAITTQPDASGLPRKFSGIAYSGGIIPAYGWHGDAAIDLSTLKTGGEIFALVDHNPEKRAGKLRARLENNQLHIEGEFFASTDAGKEVAATFAEGAPWQMSVGIQAQVESSDQPRAISVNGQILTVNTLFKNASLREVSFVPVGADPNTSAIAFAPHTNPTGENMMELEQLKARVAELSAQLAAVTTERDAVIAEATAQRKAELATLFLGKTLTTETEAAYLSLNAAQFAIVRADLSAKPVIPANLTKELAVGDPADSGASIDPKQISLQAVALIKAEAEKFSGAYRPRPH